MIQERLEALRRQMQKRKIDIYVARHLKPGHQHLDEDEFIDVKAYDVEELCEMIYSGQIEDSKTIAAIMSYRNKYC